MQWLFSRIAWRRRRCRRHRRSLALKTLCDAKSAKKRPKSCCFNGQNGAVMEKCARLRDWVFWFFAHRFTAQLFIKICFFKRWCVSRNLSIRWGHALYFVRGFNFGKSFGIPLEIKKALIIISLQSSFDFPSSLLLQCRRAFALVWLFIQRIMSSRHCCIIHRIESLSVLLLDCALLQPRPELML